MILFEYLFRKLQKTNHPAAEFEQNRLFHGAERGCRTTWNGAQISAAELFTANKSPAGADHTTVKKQEAGIVPVWARI